METKEGELHSGDNFYILTDALSRWFLEENAEGKHTWLFLRDMGKKDCPPFDEWIAKLRTKDDRMNDDATFLRVEVKFLE